MTPSSFLPVVVLLWGLACSNTLPAQIPTTPRLVDVTTSASRPTPADQAAMERQRREPSIDWIVPIQVDLTALDYDQFDAYLFDQHLSIRKIADLGVGSGSSTVVSKLYTPQGKSFVRQSARRWRGEVVLPGDRPDHDYGGLRDVMLTRLPMGGIHGSITIDEIVYLINRLPSGGHMLIKQDLSKLPQGNDVLYPDRAIDM